MKENYKFKEINFTPVSNRIVVKCPKFITYKEMQRVRDVDAIANKGTDPKEVEQVTKLEAVEVKYWYQIMEVVAVPKDDKLGLQVGDQVVVDFRAAKKFDTYKDMYWLWAMDIMGIVNKE